MITVGYLGRRPSRMVHSYQHLINVERVRSYAVLRFWYRRTSLMTSPWHCGVVGGGYSTTLNHCVSNSKWKNFVHKNRYRKIWFIYKNERWLILSISKKNPENPGVLREWVNKLFGPDIKRQFEVIKQLFQRWGHEDV